MRSQHIFSKGRLRCRLENIINIYDLVTQRGEDPQQVTVIYSGARKACEVFIVIFSSRRPRISESAWLPSRSWRCGC